MWDVMLGMAAGSEVLETAGVSALDSGQSAIYCHPMVTAIILAAVREIPTKRGLHLMDTPGQDGESTTGMVAGGCQIVLFTTGRGTPTGHPLAPVIKITGNSDSYRRLFDNIDINTGTVIDGGKSLREAGEEILREVLAVASGKLTKAEILGHDELMTVWRPSSEHGHAYGCGEWA